MEQIVIAGSHLIPTTKKRVDLGADFYPTPIWATYALLDNERFNGSIWEPACGDGSMSKVLKTSYNDVRSTDLYDYGYGDHGIDFFKSDSRADNIITNPPFHSAQQFAEAALAKADHKVALLLRLAFLEGGSRAKTIFAKTPPTRLWVFSERITFYPNGVQTAGSGTTAHAWFIWDKNCIGQTTELKWLMPIYKNKKHIAIDNYFEKCTVDG